MTTQTNNADYVLLSDEVQQVPIDAARLAQLQQSHIQPPVMTHDTSPKLPITRGSRVKFDKDGTTLTGTIFHFVPDISNGRKHAVVEIEHELPGVTHIVPVDQLTPALNIVFLTGAVDCFKPDMGDRRFMAVSIDSKRAS